MMVMKFKSVRNFVTEEALFLALDSSQSKFSQEDFDKMRKNVEA